MSNQVIGKRIRVLREEKQMSREELAAKAEISSKFLYEIENGKKGISAGTLLKISKALACSCDCILYGTYSVDEENKEKQMCEDLLKGFTKKQYEIIREILMLVKKYMD